MDGKSDQWHNKSLNVSPILMVAAHFDTVPKRGRVKPCLSVTTDWNERD